MTHTEIRRKFLDFFEKRGHVIVPSSSLLPDDPSVLFTTAGMQQFKKYYTGELSAEKDFKSPNTVSIQKCIRTSDIDEVGDERHLTFFEMLGNFSFGGYFKKEAIQFAYGFIVKEMGLTIDYVSVFGGEDGVPADEDSETIWKSLDPGITVKKFGRADNFWGPTGEEGPCGPTTEIYVDGIEIWNVVFNQYYQKKDPPSHKASDGHSKTLEPLKTPGIDTGMGLERLAMVVQKKKNIFETDLLEPLILSLPTADTDQRRKRIIADHMRAGAFMISDGIRPSNKDQGYVLRRLLRRSIVHAHLASSGSFSGNDILGMGYSTDLKTVLSEVVREYSQSYKSLILDTILSVFDEEDRKFRLTFRNGLKELRKLEKVDSSSAFKLFESYGLPYEILKELGGDKAKTLTRESFDAKFKEHQEKSRAGAVKKFGGHGLLLDTGELKAANEEELKKVTRLHTATHMLHQALRIVLGNSVHQAGSDITVERTRFDFTFDRKLAPDEIKKIEDIVNEKVLEDLPMQKVVLPKPEAEKTGALFFFKEKYPDPVNVYFIGKDLQSAFSKEFCGGPHVTHTGEIGKFKISKEEAVSAGVRRIRATVE